MKPVEINYNIKRNRHRTKPILITLVVILLFLLLGCLYTPVA